MSTNFFLRSARVLAGVAVVSVGSSAFAASTWVFGDNNPVSECTAGEVTSGTCSATISDPGAPNLKGFAVSSTASGPAFADATLMSYSGGLGVQANGTISDSGSPQHSTDNSGYTDAIVLGFTGYTFDLDAIKIGWKGNSTGGTTNADADISVFRYTGTEAAPSPVGTNLVTSALNADGWVLVGNYADLSTSSAKAVNSTNSSSSWWLISAYNVAYGAAPAADQGTVNTAANAVTGLQGGNDYFKVLSIAGTATKVTPPPQGVPEPGSIALLGLGLVGMVAVRRRKQASR